MSYEEHGDREASRVAQCGEETCYSLYFCPLQESFNLSITSWQIDGETMETVTDFLFLGSKITADGYCRHEIKRCLLFGRKAMANLDSILKSRDITLTAKVCLVSSVQLSLSYVWLFATPWTTAGQASLSITNSWRLLKLMSIESVMPSNHLKHHLSKVY